MNISNLSNAMRVYSSYLTRKVLEKPKVCHVPKRYLSQPNIFDNANLCMDCNCKISCRYVGGVTKLGYVSVKRENILNDMF